VTCPQFQQILGIHTYVEPLPVKLGTINKQVKKKGQYQLVEKEIFAYKVPFLQQLEHLLSLNGKKQTICVFCDEIQLD
jgi:hypothetical protein